MIYKNVKIALLQDLSTNIFVLAKESITNTRLIKKNVAKTVITFLTIRQFYKINQKANLKYFAKNAIKKPYLLIYKIILFAMIADQSI